MNGCDLVMQWATTPGGYLTVIGSEGWHEARALQRAGLAFVAERSGYIENYHATGEAMRLLGVTVH